MSRFIVVESEFASVGNPVRHLFFGTQTDAMRFHWKYFLVASSACSGVTWKI